MHQLPLTLTVRSVRVTDQGVDFACVVEDAKGESVRFVPMTTGPVSAAEAFAILQGHADTLAKDLLRQGKAQLVEVSQSEEERVKALEAMVGLHFEGSTVRV
jgi:hypothetical protein